jgi:hypothetical protein
MRGDRKTTDRAVNKQRNRCLVMFMGFSDTCNNDIAIE